MNSSITWPLTPPAAGDLAVAVATREDPLVQAVAAVAEPVARSRLGPAMKPSSDMDM